MKIFGFTCEKGYHSFVARYSGYSPDEIIKLLKAANIAFPPARAEFAKDLTRVKSRYICDVCKSCGKKIFKNELGS